MPIQYRSTRASRRQQLLVTAVLALSMIACKDSTGVRPLTATQAVGPTGRILRLSLAPNALPEAGTDGVELKVMFDVGGPSADIGYPIDVEELPHGRIVALDRETIGLEAFDSTGRLVGRYGREGDGPGELRSPIGLTRAGDAIVITGMRKDRALMIVDTAGRPLRHFPPPVPGDWSRATQRFSLTGSDFPWYPAREDVPLRLTGIDDTSVAILVAANEWTTDPDRADASRMPPRPIWVIRVSITNGQVLSTLWDGRTPEAQRRQVRADVMPDWEFPAYAAWPSVASGAGWYALSDGESAEIKVVGATGVDRIEWTPHPIPIDDRVRDQDFNWYVRQMTRYSDSWAAWWDSLGVAGQTAARQETFGWHTWAGHGPEITALLGSGRCLWIAGFAPSESPTAVSRNWVVVDVVEGKVLGVARLPDPWFRLRSVGLTGVFATYRDDDGSPHIVKMALPDGLTECVA